MYFLSFFFLSFYASSPSLPASIGVVVVFKFRISIVPFLFFVEIYFQARDDTSFSVRELSLSPPFVQ